MEKQMSAAIEAANDIARVLEQIELALADGDLYSGELAVLVASVTSTQDKMRDLLPRLISRVAIVGSEEREAAARCSRNHAPWANEPAPNRNLKRS
jgi:hypothetical protein